jgi:hypothetical protein
MKAIITTHNVPTTNTSEIMSTPGGTGVIQPAIIRKKELAKRLSVSTRTIDTWMMKRLIPYIQVTSRFHLFEFDAVIAALKKQYGVETVKRM